MRLERLDNSNRHYFEKAFSLYEHSFPEDERRDIGEQERAMKNSDYHFDLILNDCELYGIMLYWETEDIIFLEHFATMPQIRGKGTGTLALELLKKKGKTILLEIEPPVDEMTERRYGFYKRNGFLMNPYYHIQAKYHLGDEDLELKILSYPQVLTREQYECFYEYMTREIGIQANLTSDIEVRPLREGDDIEQVAKLIYLTDPYIYPYWFDTMEQAQRVICEMIKLPTLYNMENITVAVADNGAIAGALVSKMTPFTERKEDIYLAFERAEVKRDERTDRIFNDYYSKMGTENEGMYIANLAVDPSFRKRGIGATLLLSAIKDKELCALECVVANAGSCRLYQRLGFKIAYEYPGVFDIPCYKMIKKN